MRVADYLIERLADLSIDRIFMITGRGVLYLSDAVAKHEGIKHTSMHHEQACAYAAQAYAMGKNGVGACLVSTGCGATNAITGVLNAWQDGIPVIFISGQHMLKETTHHTKLSVRTYGQQEADIVSLARPITKYAVMLDDPNTAVYEIDKALFLATEGRKGPVWIDIPLDIQNARVDPEKVPHYTKKATIIRPAEADIKYAIDEIKKSSRPVFLVGSGVRLSGGEAAFTSLAEKTGIPVVFDSSASDIYPDNKKYSIGTIGAMGGSRAGNFAVQNADLVLSIGCRLSSAQVGDDPNAFAREAKLVVVDIDRSETLKGAVKPDRFILSDAALFISRLLDSDITECSKEWRDICVHWKEIFPKRENFDKDSDEVDLYSLVDVIGNAISEGTTVVSDAGIEELVVPAVVCKKEGVRMIHPASQGCMGFALPASVGAYYSRERDVIAIIGDGSVMMNLQELESIRFNKVPVKIFVINNNCYDVIRQRQKELFRDRTIGTDAGNGVSCPDFESVAKAFDFEYIRIENKAEMKKQVEDIINMEGFVICEVIGRSDQPFLRNSYVVGDKRRLIKRHLEDQMPFMDRVLFHKEMIVTPTDDYMEA